LEQNSTDKAKSLLNILAPSNIELFQTIKIAPEALTDGRNSKASRAGGEDFPDERYIHIFLLGFLKTDNITKSIRDLVSNWIPFSGRIDAPYIPGQHIPVFS